MYRNFGKRCLDAIFACLALIMLFPLMIVVGLAVRAKLGKPIIFKQVRIGYHDKPFTLYKFRSMREIQKDSHNQVNDEQRLTRFGRILRASSLDELPELWNILRGDMSFIGPRPLLVEYLPLYSEEQRKRHWVRPGLSGLAQINGRNTLDWNSRFALDVEYVTQYGFIYDFRILLRTFYKVFAREGISSQTSSTMEPFQGNEKSTTK